MTDDSTQMAACGACQAIIPLDSEVCPSCNVRLAGEEPRWECGACGELFDHQPRSCSACGVVFVSDDVVDVLRTWMDDNKMTALDIFGRFDTNDDKIIDAQELKDGLLALNLAALPPSEVDRLVETIDANGDGSIDLSELQAILESEEAASDDANVEEAPVVEATDDDDDDDDDEEDHDDDDDEEDHDDDDDEEDHDEEDDDDDDDDEEDHDDDDDDEEEEAEDREDPFGALLDALEDRDVTQMFHEVDTDGSQTITHEELSEAIANFTGVDFTELDIVAIIQHLDADKDGSIDMVEFVQAIENYDGLVEPVVKPPKTFPTPMQKSMMSKRWNDVVWPLIHAGFGLILVLLLVNGLIGPVNGEGGNVELEMTQSHIDSYGPSYLDGATGETYLDGDVYPCAPSVQEGKCRNSLTPLAGVSDGEGGLKSMPKAFYWDAYLGLGVSIIGLLVSLTLHYVIVPGWRTRSKAMKQLEQDHEDASSDAENDDEDYDDVDEDYDDEDYDDEDYDDEDYDDEDYDDDDDEDYDDEDDEDAIDVGDDAGVVVDGEEYYGTIIAFDDDEGTVTIEDEETGDQVTGDQSTMFLE